MSLTDGCLTGVIPARVEGEGGVSYLELWFGLMLPSSHFRVRFDQNHQIMENSEQYRR